MIRLATIGTGTITGQLLEAARGVVDVVVCHSRDAGRGAALAARHGVPESTTDLSAMLAREDLDAVYVASPNAVHEEQVRQALEAGKHVLAEKPLTTGEPSTAALLDLADSRGLVLLEALRTAFDPGTREVAALVPLLGSVRHVSFRYCQRSGRYDKVLAGEQVNVFDPAMGGGALNDLGVYVVRPFVELFGMPEHVAAAQVVVGSGADGTTTILATSPGLVAELTCSKITASSLPSEIQGELGTLTVDHLPAPRHLVLERHDGERREVRVDPPASTLGPEVRRFAELVEGGLRPVRETEHSLLTARVLDLARAAARPA